MALSERLERIRPSGIREIFDLTQRVGDVINLGIGEPDFNTPDHIKNAAKQALDRDFTKYTPNAGIYELREAISRKIKRENDFEADPSREIMVTVGATQALLLALSVILHRGDEVLIPSPGFSTFVMITEIAGGIPKEVEAREADGYKIQPEDLARQTSRKTKVIIVNSPSNPTGAVLDRRILHEIADLALEHDLFVVSDEIYEKFVYGSGHESFLSMKKLKDKLILINGFSKTYAMTGWRLGYAVAPEDVISGMIKFQMYNATCPVSFVQRAAIAALEGPQDFISENRKEFDSRRTVMCQGLKEIPDISFVVPEGAFYVFPNVSRVAPDSAKFCKRLLSEGKVATVPGSAFGRYGEGHIRLSYAASRQKIQTALERLKSFFKEVHS